LVGAFLVAPPAHAITPYTAPSGALTEDAQVDVADIQCLVLIMSAMADPIPCTEDGDCLAAGAALHSCRKGLQEGLVCLPQCLAPEVTLAQSPEDCAVPDGDGCLGTVLKASADMNCDGDMTIVDLLFLVQIALEKTGGPGKADHDEDGQLNFCDPDSDGDGVADTLDCRPLDESLGACTESGQGCLLVDGQWDCACLPGWYDDGDSCMSCNASCTICTGPTSAECQACADGYFLEGQICVLVCPEGTFGKLPDNVCESCNPACATCFGPTSEECTSCLTNYYYHAPTTTCGENCPDGYYEDPLDNQCNACTSPCATCNTTGTDCSSCLTGYFLQPDTNTCTDHCPDGFDEDPENNTCIPSN